MTTTTQIRSWWAPACKANAADLTPAYKALDACLKKHNYRPEAYHTGSFNCRMITGGSNYSLHAYDPSGFFYFWTGVRVTMALAVDINWQRNPYGKTLVTDMPPAMIRDIKAIRTGNGKQLWRWGGDYAGNKDAMHFEIIVSPADLMTGVKMPEATTPKPKPKPPAEEEEEEMDQIIWYKGKPTSTNPNWKPDSQGQVLAAYRVVGLHAKWLPSASYNLCKYLGVKEANTMLTPLDSTWIETAVMHDGPFKNA